MFRLIQVPLDGSSFAEHALPLAVGLAQRDGAGIQVVRVHVPSVEIYLTRHEYLSRRGSLFDNLDRELLKHAREHVDAVATSLAEDTGVRATPVLLKGPVPEMIAQHASSSEADLLIMTTQGRGPLARFWFGSVANSLVRLSPIPILFVRPQEKTPDVAQPPTIRHVLIPLDGSNLAEQALDPALSLGDAEQVEFTLLRVVPAVIPAVNDPVRGRENTGLRTSWHEQLHDLMRELEAEAQDYLERLAERWRANSLKVHTQVIAHEQPASAILDTALSLGADAIAMTTRGQGGLKRLLLGSVADKVIRGATRPVLICPPVTGPVGLGIKE